MESRPQPINAEGISWRTTQSGFRAFEPDPEAYDASDPNRAASYKEEDAKTSAEDRHVGGEVESSPLTKVFAEKSELKPGQRTKPVCDVSDR